MMQARKVPAWQLAVSEHSFPEYVYVLHVDEADRVLAGGQRTKDARLVHRLTPVREVARDDIGSPIVGTR